jgi:hypothetical protein
VHSRDDLHRRGHPPRHRDGSTFTVSTTQVSSAGYGDDPYGYGYGSDPYGYDPDYSDPYDSDPYGWDGGYWGG